MIDFVPESYNLRLLRSLHSEKLVGKHWEVLCSLYELREGGSIKYLVRGFAALELLAGQSIAIGARTGDYVFDSEEPAAACLEHLFANLTTLHAQLAKQAAGPDYTVTEATR